MEPYKGIVDIDGKKIMWETTFGKDQKFQCTQCGACCIRQNVQLFEQDIDKIAGKGIPPEEFMQSDASSHITFLKAGKDHRCLFLDKQNQCKVHAVNPHLCSQFPFRVTFFAENKAYIDCTYKCKGILLNHAQENQMDFNALVQKEHAMMKAQVATPTYIAPVLEHLEGKTEQETIRKRVWSAIVQELNTLKRLSYLVDTVEAFEEAKSLFPALGPRDVDTYIGLAKKKRKQTPEAPSYTENELHIGITSKNPYIAHDFAKNKNYAFYLEEGCAVFEIGDDQTVRFPLAEIKRKTLADKAYLIHYLEQVWERAVTRMDLYFAYAQLLSHHQKISLLELQLGIIKRFLLLLQFLMDITAHKNGNTCIKEQDVKEAIFLYDLGMMHCVKIGLKDVLRQKKRKSEH